MTEYFPVLAAILFVVVAFLYASKRGVIGLLASGTAIGVGLALILAGFHYLPGLAKTYLDIELTWQFTLGLSACVGGLVFIILRLILAFALKHLFNPDSPLHPLVDGTPGGFLSLFPSLIAVFLFFTCVRAAGTVQELNYIDSLAQPGIERMAGKIPPPPPSILWRNAIESLPYLAPLLDLTDPFSRRRSRNAAALTIISRSAELRSHLLGDPEIAELLEAEQWKLLAADPVVAKVIGTRDRVGLVTAPAIQKAAIDFPDRTDLEKLILLPHLHEFTRSLVPVPEPEAESF
jgi:hypothetical protein